MPFGTKEKPYSIIIRPIDSVDAMSAQAVEIAQDLLDKIKEKINHSYPQIFAILYDLTSKPPGTIEWE